MGLTAYIYRDDLENCSNGGLSSKYTRVCVINISGPDEPREDAPAVKREAEEDWSR